MTLFVEIAFLLVIVMINRLAMIFVLNRRLHVTLTKNPVLTFLYFILMAGALALLFPAEAATLYLSGSVLMVLFCLFMLLAVNPWIYGRLKATHQIPSHLAKAYPDQSFLLIDRRFLLSKTGDVIFQQTAVGILLILLSEHGIPLSELVPLFAIIFGIIHLHLYAATKSLWATYFTISAAVGGFMLPFLILTTPGGVYLAIVLHMLWYVGSGALFGSVEAIERSSRRTR